MNSFQIVHHGSFNIRPQNQLRIHFVLLKLGRPDTFSNLRSGSRQKHLAHATIPLAPPASIRLFRKQFGNIFHSDRFLQIESLRVHQINKNFRQFVAGVIRKFKGDIKSTPQIIVPRQEQVHFGRETRQDDKRRVSARLVGVDAPDNLVHCINSRVLRPRSLGRHAKGVRLIDEENPPSRLVENLSRFCNRPPLIRRNQIHAFDLQKLRFAQNSEFVIHLRQEAGDGGLSGTWISEEYHVRGAGSPDVVGEGDSEHCGG
mmetsp:Transcript_26976/g.55439  ORF Transcript_26976/g.55439 Transcript_26976/m.55439 type:complete len:259 (+) Transcript_26976:62-838(+)